MFRYDPVLQRAVNGLSDSTPEARQLIYQRARGALLAQLQKVDPPLPDAEAASQQRAFEDAVVRVEAQIGAARTLPEPSADLKEKDARGSWFTEILARASEDESPAPAPAEPPQQPLQTEHLPERQASILPFLRRFSTERIEADRAKPSESLDELAAVLKKLQSESAGIAACLLIAEDGSIIAGSLPPGMQEARVAGVAATLQTLGARAADELSRGETKEVMVRGNRGYAILVKADQGALLLVLTDDNSQLGLILLDIRKAFGELEKALVGASLRRGSKGASRSLQGVG